MAVPIGLDEHFRHRYSLYPGDDQSGNSTLSNKSVLGYDMLANMRVSGALRDMPARSLSRSS